MRQEIIKRVGQTVTFTAPNDGVYTLTAAGGDGSQGNTYSGDYGSVGGKGAQIKADFGLKKGDELLIIPAGHGSGSKGTAKDGASGGSGGGTFVFKKIGSITDSRYQFAQNANYEVLLVAAGGGGTWDESYNGSQGNGRAGNGANFYSPTNYQAWSTSTASNRTSISVSTTLSIDQFKSNGAEGAFYTRNSSTGRGGYGMGSATDDNRSYGGGWRGSGYIAYSWSSGTNTVGYNGDATDKPISDTDVALIIDIPDPTYSVLDMVTDRTIADVKAKNNKGCYNADDLARVEVAVGVLSNKLYELGYKYPITDIKVDWSMTGYPTYSQMVRYVNNLKSLSQQLTTVTSYSFDKYQNWTHEDANEFEKMIVNLDTSIVNLEKNIDLGWALGLANLELYGSV